MPDNKDLLEKTQKFRMRQLTKVIFSNLALLATTAYIGVIGYRSVSDALTEKIGLTLILLAILMFLCVYNQIIPLLLKVEYYLSSVWPKTPFSSLCQKK